MTCGGPVRGEDGRMWCRCRTLTFGLSLALTSCGSATWDGGHRSASSGSADADGTPRLASMDLLEEITASDIAALNRIESDDDEMLRVMAEAGGGGERAASLMSRRATGMGVLPELLTPQVRRGVAGSGFLKALATQPLLGQLFDLAEVVRDNIRSTLGEKLAAGVAHGSTIAERVMLRFDGMAPMTDGMTRGMLVGAARERRVRMDQQALAWSLPFSHGEVWEGQGPLDGVDHGLQAYVVSKSMMEWGYLFGLGQEGQRTLFGGVLVDPRRPTMVAGAYLREGGAPRMLASSYRVSYPEADLLTYSSEMLERWSVEKGEFELGTQATVWRAMGQAFGRLRADRRGVVAGLFDNADREGLLPVNAHELPLVGLAMVGDAINSDGVGFFDTRGRLFRKYYDPTGLVAGESADLKDLAMMVDAMGSWAKAVETIEGAGLSAEATARVEEAPAKLRRGLQFGAQALIARAVVSVDDVQLLRDLSGGFNPIDFADGLHALFVARRVLGESPHFDAMLSRLTRGYLRSVVLPAFESGAFTEAGVLWARLIAADVRDLGGWPDARWVDRMLTLIDAL